MRRLWSFEPAVYWHVRATAVFGISFAVLLVWLARNRAPQLRGALVVLGLLAVQMAIGEIAVPHASAVVARARARHARGDRLGGAVTAFVFSLWRPRRTERMTESFAWIRGPRWSGRC